MRKLLLTLAIIIITAISYSGVVYAEETDKDALYYVENQRTDVYIQDYYKQTSELRNDPEVIAKMQAVTAGLTSDYEKAKAIYHEVEFYGYWASNIPDKGGGCYYDAKTIEALMQAAGFPAKYISGRAGGGNHAWNEVFVDGRWVFMDGSGAFDESVLDWSYHYTFNFKYALDQEKEIWDGSLYFVDSTNDRVLKEVKNFPLNGLVTSTYGFDIDTLYVDRDFETPFTLNTMQVTFPTSTIYVQMEEGVVITFDSKGGTAVQPVITKGYGEKIKKPANPTKSGYKFVGWYVEDGADAVDFSTWTFDYDLTLYAKWKKSDTKTTNYKVTFNSNNGTPEQSVTVTANSTISKPKNPTKTGYKFVNWYKDSKCTKVWNFKTDNVQANTTLYAKWKKK